MDKVRVLRQNSYNLGFYGIYLLVALQHRRRDEGLLAQVALILFVAVMNHLDVHVERVLPLEGGVALVALERPLTCSRDTAVIGCRYLKDSHHAQHGDHQFPPRPDCAGGKYKKEGFFGLTPHNTLEQSASVSFFNISEELLRLLQHMIEKPTKKAPPFMSHSTVTPDSVQTVQLFTECRLMFSFTPQ